MRVSASRCRPSSSPCMSCRYSASALASPSYAGGKSRRRLGSSESPSSRERSSAGSSRRRRRSSRDRRSSKWPSRVRWIVFRKGTLVLPHRRPEAVGVQASDVVLSLLTRTARDDGLPLVVYLQHELPRPRFAVPEQFPEDEGDVRHEVDRVVPDDHDPRAVVLDFVLGGRSLKLDLSGRGGGRAHSEIVAFERPIKRRGSRGASPLTVGCQNPVHVPKMRIWMCNPDFWHPTRCFVATSLDVVLASARPLSVDIRGRTASSSPRGLPCPLRPLVSASSLR